jgi:hypothetical protein
LPGSVVAAAPVDVMPLSLSRAFMHERTWHMLANEYRLGESQRRFLPATSRKSWRLAKRLTTDELDDLRTFVEAHVLTPFYIYDGTETTPKWSWDVTGAVTVGRYTVRFENPEWIETLGFPRHNVEVRLIEVS